ncbi:MAG: hypothetical protein CL503_01155 [Actinobacteria bacterium]|nr:hypothetical protein [Actinomycetota bacterium]|tara:strand:- start:4082 stop:4393 length:312 start_codon:yes stop_codon:yes gene_type:complete
MFTIGPSNVGNSNALRKKRSKDDEVNQEDTTTGTEIKRVKSDSRVPEVDETPKTPQTPSPTTSPPPVRATLKQDADGIPLVRTKASNDLPMLIDRLSKSSINN